MRSLIAIVCEQQTKQELMHRLQDYSKSLSIDDLEHLLIALICKTDKVN